MMFYQLFQINDKPLPTLISGDTFFSKIMQAPHYINSKYILEDHYPLLIKSTSQKLHNPPNPSAYIGGFMELNQIKYLTLLDRSQIEGYTCLLIFRKFSILPAVILAFSFINFKENFQPPCFFTNTNEIFAIPPAVIRAQLIKFEEKIQSTHL